MSKRHKRKGGDAGTSAYSLATTQNNNGTPRWSESRARFRMEGEPAKVVHESPSRFAWTHSLGRASVRRAWQEFAAQLEVKHPEMAAYAKAQAAFRTPLRERVAERGHAETCKCIDCNEILDELTTLWDAE